MNAKDYFSSGYGYFLKGDYQQAIANYKKALQVDPGYGEVYVNLGAAYQSRGQSQAAITAYKQALKINPRQTAAHFNLGSLYESLRQYPQAAASYRQTINLNPKDSEACLALGNLYKKIGSWEKARKFFTQTISLDPTSSQAYFNLATLLTNMGSSTNNSQLLSEAIQVYQKLLQIKPEFAEAMGNLGLVLRMKGDSEKALESYKKSLEIKPDLAQVHNNMGIIYESQGNLQEALNCFRKSLQVNPDFGQSEGNFAYALKQACQWDELTNVQKNLKNHTNASLKQNRRPGETPFFSVINDDDPAKNLQVAKAWSNEIEVSPVKLIFPKIWIKHKKIRIGYVSDGFREFPTAHNITRVFELHDRSQFEIYLYSHGPDDKSVYRDRIIKTADKFIDISHLEFAAAAKRILTDKINILVDLKGYTRGNRLEIFAYRPAPIQVAYLGFPGTTGAGFLDYMIADRIVIPEKSQKFFTEKIVYLPISYRATDNQVGASVHKFKRSDFNLPPDSLVIASFNQTYKITKELFGVWMKVLKTVPRSILWQWCTTDLAKTNLKHEAVRRGISPQRILFAGNAKKEDHLARLRLADLALDTFPCNGHTTTVDALWAGLPVVTLLGKNFSSRVSASVLTAINLPQLITKNLKEYQRVAVDLAAHPDKLCKLKDRLKQNIKSSPLFDTEKYTRELEKAYIKIWTTRKH